MKIFPAIDIMNGGCVRLFQGDYGRKTAYAVTPYGAAEKFCGEGASYLHIVDLDGARYGRAANAAVIKEIVSSFGLKVEVGGGIRTFGQIEDYLSAGAYRVILGTAALKDRGFLLKAAALYGDRIAVGVDAKNGFVAVKGWREVTGADAVAFCGELAAVGVKDVIYTDISRDGSLDGVNTEIYGRLMKTDGLKITASGGISSAADISALAALGLDGAVLGKALYENVLSLKEALAAAEVGNAG